MVLYYSWVWTYTRRKWSDSTWYTEIQQQLEMWMFTPANSKCRDVQSATSALTLDQCYCACIKSLDCTKSLGPVDFAFYLITLCIGCSRTLSIFRNAASVLALFWQHKGVDGKKCAFLEVYTAAVSKAHLLRKDTHPAIGIFKSW